MADDLKRQELPDGLYVVATPIGNLGDLTERARQALAAAQTIFAEDTRQAAKLFSALGVSLKEKRLERLDAHAPESKLGAWAAKIAEGGLFAFVSDAGTPGISDPGSALVRRAREAGAKIVPIPGPSAVMALLSAGGFDDTAFVFRGFFPRKAKEREAELAEARASRAARLFVWFESPLRVLEALRAVEKAEPEAQVVASKELTKLHERFFWGSAREARESVEAELAREGERGEWSFAVRFAELAEDERETAGESSDWVKALQCLLDARVPASEAARQVSQHFGTPRKIAYEQALKFSGKKV